MQPRTILCAVLAVSALHGAAAVSARLLAHLPAPIPTVSETLLSQTVSVALFLFFFGALLSFLDFGEIALFPWFDNVEISTSK